MFVYFGICVHLCIFNLRAIWFFFLCVCVFGICVLLCIWVGWWDGAPAVWRVGRMVSWGVPAIDFDSGGGGWWSQDHQHHPPSHHHHHASTSSSSSSNVCFRIASSFFFFFRLQVPWRPDLLEHMQCVGIIERGSQTGSTFTRRKLVTHVRVAER